jgi:hypothetical protein
MRKLITLVLAFAFLNHVNILLAADARNTAIKNDQLSRFSDGELKNQDILDMIKNGLPTEIIIAKIKSSKCAFDTSTQALQELKAARVPESIIFAMVESPFSQSVVVKIPDNTSIHVESAFDISSATVAKGQLITFRVISPLIIDGMTVIEKGALVNGKIVKAKKAGRWGREGTFAWTFEDVATVDGKPIPIKAEGSIEGESNKGEVAIKTVAVGALLAPSIILTPLALMYGFKRGKNAVLPAGSRFIVYTKGDANVMTKKFSR